MFSNPFHNLEQGMLITRKENEKNLWSTTFICLLEKWPQSCAQQHFFMVTVPNTNKSSLPDCQYVFIGIFCIVIVTIGVSFKALCSWGINLLSALS